MKSLSTLEKLTLLTINKEKRKSGIIVAYTLQRRQYPKKNNQESTRHLLIARTVIFDSVRQRENSRLVQNKIHYCKNCARIDFKEALRNLLSLFFSTSVLFFIPATKKLINLALLHSIGASNGCGALKYAFIGYIVL